MASDTCQRLTELASEGVAPALRAVDCVANEMAAGAFGRLFGSDGALVPAISILLALYIALFAFLLMTGRASVGVSSLMPRMITIGVVLLFTSSWLAYQGMVWSFALAGPDWIAGQLMGADGSATQIFADRIDIVFGVINEIGTNAGSGSGSAGEAAKDVADAASMMSPEGLMWMGAILLLLGTVGILLTARIALGILIALGPLFVILGLFGATRGLTAGWLRGMVLTAFTPLFVVMGGGIILELLVPIVSALVSSAQLGEIDGRAAMAFFTVAAVHVALMVMVFKVAGTMVSGWRVFGLASAREERAGSSAAAPAPAPVAPMLQPLGVATSRTGHMSAMAASQAAQAGPGGNGGEGASGRSGERRTVTTHVTGGGIAPAGAGQDMRAKGIGSRFRSASNDTGRAPVKEKTR